MEAQRNAETRRAERDGGRTDAPHIETRRLKRFRDPHRALVVTQDHRNDLAGGWRQVKTGADFLTGMRPQIGQSVAQIVGRSDPIRSEEHTSELQSLMRISYAVFFLNKKHKQTVY